MRRRVLELSWALSRRFIDLVLDVDKNDPLGAVLSSLVVDIHLVLECIAQWWLLLNEPAPPAPLPLANPWAITRLLHLVQRTCRTARTTGAPIIAVQEGCGAGELECRWTRIVFGPVKVNPDLASSSETTHRLVLTSHCAQASHIQRARARLQRPSSPSHYAKEPT